MKKKKIAIVVCTFLFIYFLGGVIYSFIEKDKEENTPEIKIGDTIKNYNYILYENDTEIYSKEYKNLKKILESKEIDYKEYAIGISKLFLIDLYTLDNKKNKYDIGGIEFIYPNSVENYKLNVENTIYKYIIDNTNGKREQELPIVKNVELIDIEETEYKIDDNEFEAYNLNLNIEYEKDLEYDKRANIIIIKQDKNLYIVEKK